MKKLVLIILVTLSLSFQAEAQRGLKIGYVDMDYILENVPEYQQANQQLSNQVQKWKTALEKKMQIIADLKESLDTERALLTRELIEEREAEIKYEEEQMFNYQQEKFGPNGALITQKKQLLQPVQDQVFNAVQEIGSTREYDFIYENSADALMLYSANRHDISDQVLRMIERSARKQRVDDRKNKKVEEEKPKKEVYKSVTKAREDAEEEKERTEEREAIVNKREQELQDRKNKRDSLRQARKREFEERRNKILQERQRMRDSLQEVRNRNK